MRIGLLPGPIAPEIARRRISPLMRLEDDGEPSEPPFAKLIDGALVTFSWAFLPTILAVGLALHGTSEPIRVGAPRDPLAFVVPPAVADSTTMMNANDERVASGVVTLKEGVQASEEAQALYVTVRVVPSNNVPLYISAGKVPPLASARFAGPISFPFSFSLTTKDLTPEFAGTPRAQWEAQDLVVSCRLDTDGVAATRDSADLVGRGTQGGAGTGSPVEIALEGRGLTGRILTAK